MGKAEFGLKGRAMAGKARIPTKVWRFEMFDITHDEYVTSSRYATDKVIAEIGGRRIEGTETEIDGNLLDANGMTSKNFGR